MCQCLIATHVSKLDPGQFLPSRANAPDLNSAIITKIEMMEDDQQKLMSNKV